MRNLIIIGAVLLVLVSTGVSYKTKSLRQGSSNLRVKTQENAQSDFVIKGSVINADGEVVAGAKVFAEMDNGGVSRIMSDVSDKQGHFRIRIRELGNYTIYGSKEEDGYPLTVSGFHQQVSLDQIPKLNIIERKPVTNVVLQLGAKAATIEGTITDALSSQVIKRATITLRRTDNPDLFYRTSTEEMQPGKFKIVVPIKPFVVEVEASDYEGWIYGNGPTGLLRLNRGESRKLEIALRKKRDQ